MTPNRMRILIVGTMLLSSVGCSGSRLRSLVTRSDYQTLEELEARDAEDAERAIVDKSLSGSDSARFASQERELDEEESSRFSLSLLFSRKSDDSEIGEDPFVDAPSTAAVEKAKEPVIKAEEKPIATTAQTKAEVKVPVEVKQSNFGTTLTDVEKQAEDLFAELSAAEATARENPFADSKVASQEAVEEIKEQAKAKVVESNSFEEFMARRASAKASVDSSIAMVQELKEQVEEPVKAAKQQSAASFDSLLGEITPKSEPVKKTNPPTAFDEGLFPGLSEALEEAEAELDPASMFGDSDAASAEFGETKTAMFGSESVDGSDPFAAASAKHGFQEVKQKDPWASFEGSSVNREMSWSSQDLNAAGSPDSFVWDDSEAPRPTPAIDAKPSNTGTMPVFTQVSSSASASTGSTTRAGYSVDHGPALVIPDVTPQAQPFELSLGLQEESSAPESSLESDPFFTSVPQAMPATNDMMLSDETGVAAKNGWPTRTWFFILGCLIVAYLLFMPDRQNRAKA